MTKRKKSTPSIINKKSVTDVKKPLPATFLNTKWDWIVLALILIMVFCMRFHLLSVPLERDEGEYAYAGQLILQGIPPYLDVYNMKMPGIYAAYAFIIATFGKTQTGIHIGLMIINMATIVLLFLLGKRILDSICGLVAGATFAVISVSQQVQGVFANAEHFVILFSVGGILLLIRAIDLNQRRYLAISGLLFGLSFMLKQHGAFFFIFASIYLLFNEWQRQHSKVRNIITKYAIFALCAALPFIFTCLFFQILGIFDKFWFWTFTYAQEYVSLNTFSDGWDRLVRNLTAIIKASPFIWLLAGVGLFSLFRDNERRHQLFFGVTFIIFSFLALFPGLYFRLHYFILILPAVSILSGIAISSFNRSFSKTTSSIKLFILISVFLIAVFHSIYQQRIFLFQVDPFTASRMVYLYHPFPEALQIAEYINKNTSKNDRIAIIGSEPEIYFYANRRAATGYIYTYPLMEKHKYALKMQQEFIHEIESHRPKFLVYVHMPASWLGSAESNKLIFDWFEKYQHNYNLVGIVDIISPWKTLYFWDEAIKDHLPQSRSWITILRIKPFAEDLKSKRFLNNA